MEPNGDQKICLLCDLKISNFKILELTLQNLHQQHSVAQVLATQPPATQAPLLTSQPVAVEQTSTISSQPTIALTSNPPATVSNPTTGGPPEKKSRIEKFAINDKVLYFDTNTRSMREAVVTQIVGPKVLKIANEESKIFHINSNYLTKS